MKKLLLVFVLVVAACAGTSTETEADAPAAATASDAPDATTAPVQESPTVTQPPAEEPSSGVVAITLTIGDETWEFPGALCAYKHAPAGEEGSEWNVSHSINGLQVYIADDEFGTLVSIDDIENSGNPTVYWEAIGGAVTITVTGNDVTASGTFTDLVTGGTAQGTLAATCPDWFDAT